MTIYSFAEPINLWKTDLKQWINDCSRGSDIWNFIESDQEVASYQLVVSWVIAPKSDFLLIEAGTITPKGSMNTANMEKLHCLLSKIMNNKQVLVYGVLESTNDLRSIFMGHIHFKKLMNFENILKYFTVACPGSGTRNKVSFNYIYW